MADFFTYDQEWRGDWFGMRTFAASAVWNQYLSGGTIQTNSRYLYAVPFFCSSGGTAKSIHMYTTSIDSGARWRLGVYGAISSSNVWPGALLFDSGVQIAGPTVHAELLTASMSQVLSSGQVYWFTAMMENWGEVMRQGGTRFDAGWWTDSAGDGVAGFTITSWTFGPMPATFPTGGYDRGQQPRIAIMWT